MAKRQDDNDGCANVVGGFVVFVIVLIAMIPKPVWIFLGVVTAVAVVVGLIVKMLSAHEKNRAAAAERSRANQEAQAADAKRQREENASKRKQRRIEELGAKNAARVDSALAAVKKVAASEAASTGWLGDIDFTADIQGITENFRKVHALRKVAAELSALDKPSADDRRILAEAKTTAANLECISIERVELIGKCAIEARLIDESLSNERQEARTAEQRAALHAKLSGMLYGIEATPDASPSDSAADAVLGRVQAYREIKNQIQLGRGDGL